MPLSHEENHAQQTCFSFSCYKYLFYLDSRFGKKIRTNFEKLANKHGYQVCSSLPRFISTLLFSTP